MPRVWIDTDIGSDVDDAVALLCAARHPEIEVVGISLVMGRVDIRAWLAQEVMTRAGVSGLPVLPGAMDPMGPRTHEEPMPSYGRLAPELPPISPKDDDSRIAAVAEGMSGLSESFHLLTIGPLTNVGRLLRRAPDIAERWEGVTCMAGRLEGKAEYNVSADAVAARIAFERLRPRLVGLETCSDALPRAEAERLLDGADPASGFLLDCYREYRAYLTWHDNPENAPLTLFDAITLLSLVQPEAFDFQSVHVLVETDGRLRLTDDGAPVQYALSRDWPAIKKNIAALLRGDGS